MKRFIKVCLILAAACTAGGIGLSVAGVAMGATWDGVSAVRGYWKGIDRWSEKVSDSVDKLSDGWGDSVDSKMEDLEERIDGQMDTVEDKVDTAIDKFFGDGEENREKVYGEENHTYRTEEIKRLDISLRYDSLYVIQAEEDDVLKITTGNDEDGQIEIQESGETLKVTSKVKTNEARYVTLRIPKGMEFEKISMEVQDGEARLETDLKAEKMEIQLGRGVLESTQKLEAKKLELEVGAGSAWAEQMDGEEVSLTCGMGTLEASLAGENEDYDYEIQCGIGSIAIGEETYSTLSNKEKVENQDADRKLEAECGIGSMELSFLE